MNTTQPAHHRTGARFSQEGRLEHLTLLWREYLRGKALLLQPLRTRLAMCHAGGIGIEIKNATRTVVVFKPGTGTQLL